MNWINGIYPKLWFAGDKNNLWCCDRLKSIMWPKKEAGKCFFFFKNCYLYGNVWSIFLCRTNLRKQTQFSKTEKKCAKWPQVVIGPCPLCVSTLCGGPQGDLSWAECFTALLASPRCLPLCGKKCHMLNGLVLQLWFPGGPKAPTRAPTSVTTDVSSSSRHIKWSSIDLFMLFEQTGRIHHGHRQSSDGHWFIWKHQNN